LYGHYANHNKDADFDKDMNLPFKSQDNCISAISNIYVSLPENFSIPPPKRIIEEKAFAIEDEFLLSSFLSNIWQPPRGC
jgi:hypothetical protein